MHPTFSFTNPCSCFLKSSNSPTKKRRLTAFLYTRRNCLCMEGDIFSIYSMISICPMMSVNGVRNSWDILVKKRSLVRLISPIRSFSSFSFLRDKASCCLVRCVRHPTTDKLPRNSIYPPKAHPVKYQG